MVGPEVRLQLNKNNMLAKLSSVELVVIVRYRSRKVSSLTE